ncbi:MAG: CDP-alcohol phosphatidyltransferase family protein [Candidatus Zixiibacteriota bacterium]
MSDNVRKKIKEEKLQHYNSEAIELNQLYTVPNILTILRIILLPFLMWSLFELQHGTSKAIPIIIGAVMLGTDLVDGYFARKLNQETRLGSLLDPISDKLIVIGLGFILYILGYLPLLFLALIFLRDLFISIFGLFVYFKMGELMQTNIFARMTPLFWGFTYILYVASLDKFALVIGILAVLMTITSGILYLVDFIQILKQDGES